MRASVPLMHVEKRMSMSATEWSLEACSREELSGKKKIECSGLSWQWEGGLGAVCGDCGCCHWQMV